jgi:hypothetical protein
MIRFGNCSKINKIYSNINQLNIVKHRKPSEEASFIAYRIIDVYICAGTEFGQTKTFYSYTD